MPSFQVDDCLSALEPRFMFDAAGVAVGAEAAADAVAQEQAEQAIDALRNDGSLAESDQPARDLYDRLLDALGNYESPADRREIVFIDTTVRDYQTLIAGIDKSAEVVLLDADGDGIHQIASVLAGRADIDAIHIVSHGNQAELFLGAARLTLDSMSGEYKDELALIGEALTANADFLIYGCNFGEGALGREATIQLAQVTGADVAASIDDTGHDRYGGDWDLEYQTGMIETSVALSAAAQQNWDGKLAVINVDTFADENNGNGLTSLREAILQVNAGAGGDTIILPAGTYTLSLGPAGDDDGNSGDLDIRRGVTITGAGAQSTIIDGDGKYRVFHIHNSSVVTMSGVTLQGGVAASDAGGILIDNSSVLNLSDAVLTNNNGDSGAGVGAGGAIHVHGALNADRVLFSGNTAKFGGAIYFANADGGSLTNVTISGNTASNNGGGVWTNTPITVTNSTITLNDSVNGGGIFADTANVTISNTIVAGNTTNSDIDDVAGSFFSDGSNLIGVVGGAADFSSDLTGVSVNLDVLAYNGGPTQTHALLAGSPAIDNGTATGAPSIDQRGFTRDASPDIGAFEIVDTELTNTAEFRVNSTITDTQETSASLRGSHQAVALAADGGYVVVWSDSASDGNGWGVYAQRFDATGTEQGTEFRVNVGNIGDEQWATVASDDSGRFVIAWTAQDGGGTGIFLRRFNSDGSAIDTADVLVNWQSTADDQLNPSIAVNNVGQMVIAWQGDNTNDGIYAKQFDMTSTATGDQVPSPIITVHTGTDQANPSVDINNDGKFVVVWQKGNEPHAQRYAADGTPRGSQIDINRGTTQFEQHPVVAVQESGDFVVVYRSEIGIFKGVWMRRYSDDGTEMTILAENVSSGSNHVAPSISMDSSGNYIIVHEGDDDGSGKGVFGRIYDSGGSAQGVQFQINQTTALDQHMASVALANLNNYVVVWSGNGDQPGEVDSSGVFARQFGVADSPPTADAGGPYVITEGDSVTLDGSASTDDGTIVSYEWDLDNDGMFGEVGEPTGVNPLVSWASLQSFGIDDDNPSYTIGLRVTDDVAQTHTVTTTLTVNNLAPTLITTGAATAIDGNIYTLNLSATDPGDDTITGWTINWGDGTVETVAGNPTTKTHTYTNSGFTFNILASATDEDGTFLQNELLVPRYVVDSVFRFEETTGAFLQQFALQTGGLDDPIQTIIGPDGNLYVSGEKSDNVVRYDPVTGTKIDEFVTANSGGLNSPGGLAFGPDGNLYVASYGTHEVLRFDGTNGTFLDAFVTGLTNAYGVAFGPDGDLYVNSFSGNTVLSYDGTTGAPLGTFVAPDAGGLSTPERMTFGPDGHLYIASSGSDEVLRYNGTTGAFIDAFVTANLGGLDSPGGLEFGPDGNLYVGSQTNDNVLRYDGTTGAFLGEYVSATTGLDQPAMFTFLPGHQVLVTAGNDAPIITSNGGGAAAAVNAAENQTSVTTVTATDADVPPDTLTFSISGGADAGSFGIDSSTGVLNFNSAPDFASPTDSGTDGVYEVTAQVVDGNGGVDTQAISVTVTPSSVNNAPVAADDVATVAEDSVDNNVAVLGNDTDVDGDLLTVNAVTQPANGLVVDNADGTFTYTPNTDFNGVDVFSYTVSDGNGGTDTASVTVTVTAANDPPLANADAATVDEGGTVTIGLAANDTDADDGLDLTSIDIVSAPSHGSLVVNTDGTVDYTHDGSENFSDSFSYRIRDIGGTLSNTATATIDITSVNDNAPVITSPASATVVENNTAVGQVVVSDADLPGDVISYSLTGGGADDGLFTIDAGGNLSFLTAPDFEIPADADGDNVYVVEVAVTDGVNIINQTLTVMVAEANAPVLIAPIGNEVTEEPADIEQSDASDVTLGEVVAIGEGPAEPIEDQLETNLTTAPEEPAPKVTQPEPADSGSEAGRDLTRKRESEPVTIPWSISRSDLSTDILDGLRDTGVDLSTSPQTSPSIEPLEVSGFVQELDRLRTEIDEDGDLSKVMVGSSVAVTTGLSIGYVVWLVRGAVLLSSMLSSLPAWRMVDPLPVLAHLGRRSKKDGDDEESLQTVIQKGAEVAELKRSKGEPETVGMP